MVQLPETPPTNTELGAKLDYLTKVVEPLVPQVKELMDDKHDRKVATDAVAQFVKDNPHSPHSSPSQNNGDSRALNQKLVTALGIALAVILALAGLITQIPKITK